MGDVLPCGRRVMKAGEAGMDRMRGCSMIEVKKSAVRTKSGSPVHGQMHDVWDMYLFCRTMATQGVVQNGSVVIPCVHAAGAHVSRAKAYHPDAERHSPARAPAAV